MTGRRALRGYEGRTETPLQNSQRVLLAKLRTAAVSPRGRCGAGCKAAHRADGAAARWGHRALPQRGTGVEHEHGAREERRGEGRGDAMPDEGCAGEGGAARGAREAYGVWMERKRRSKREAISAQERIGTSVSAWFEIMPERDGFLRRALSKGA